jgi:hypothetical protein
VSERERERERERIGECGETENEKELRGNERKIERGVGKREEEER